MEGVVWGSAGHRGPSTAAQGKAGSKGMVSLAPITRVGCTGDVFPQQRTQGSVEKLIVQTKLIYQQKLIAQQKLCPTKALPKQRPCSDTAAFVTQGGQSLLGHGHAERGAATRGYPGQDPRGSTVTCTAVLAVHPVRPWHSPRDSGDLAQLGEPGMDA